MALNALGFQRGSGSSYGKLISMKERTVLTTGIVGSVIVAICCFTPVLVILLGAAGLVAWLDHVLFPALALFLGITAYGLVLHQRRKRKSC